VQSIGAPFRMSRHAQIAILFVAALLLAVGLCEALTRWFGLAPMVHRVGLRAEQTAYRLSDNPILGFEMKPNYRDDNPTLNSSFPYVNADGQRDIEREVAKPAGRTRIIMLGDSVVVGLNIRAIDDLVSSKLEAAFDRPDIEVLNFGVMGYNTRGEVELLRTKGLKYAPDIVVLVFVDNDLNRVNGNFKNLSADRPWIAEELFLSSSLFRLLCLRFDLFNFRLETEPNYLLERQTEAVGAGDQIDEAVGELSRLAQQHGFRPFMAIWPIFTSDGIVDERPLYPGARRRIADAAAKYGVPTLSLREVFEKDLQEHPRGSDPRKTYTFDEMHPNPVGTAVMARGLRDGLIASGLIRPGSPKAAAVR
jgi:lysophospholipase L1-like esterase